MGRVPPQVVCRSPDSHRVVRGDRSGGGGEGTDESEEEGEQPQDDAGPALSSLVVAADHPAVVAPVGYEKIWSDAGADGDMQVTLWNPLPPLGPDICPGQIAKGDYGEPPPLDAVGCVHASYLQPAVVEFTWDDSGSGASWDGSVWSCKPGAGTLLVHPTFVSRRHHDGPGNSECVGLREPTP